MPFQKAIETPFTGAEASFHTISTYTVDLVSMRSAVTVQSYYSKTARDAGRQALHTWHISLMGVPPDDEPALTWLEAQLILDEVPSTGDPSQYAGPDRWVLAGAELV